MFKLISRKLFGTDNERTLRRIRPLVPAVNALEPGVQALSDDRLRAKTAEFKDKLAQGASLDDIMPEAFAVVREASRRTTGMRHFDVQLVGGAVLHQGKIAEMKTGEGKTLVATLPAYLNALSGKGVHIVTVNDYLAKRDTEWMGAIYRFLGLSVGTIQHGLGDAERYAAYRADITYGTNNEFGFDYLRDNMKFRLADLAQREFNYAIVDEVDSILIDEARTPLIISGPTNESTQLFTRVDSLVRRFEKDRHFTLDEKSRTVSIQEPGVAEAERVLAVTNLYDMANMDSVHAINTSLKAHHLFKRDVDYMVQDGKIVIVDEFTGRLMPGRRYSDGLHQALEAKERVKVEEEYQTLASVTFQNYFRMYAKLAGMTGTAATEATEFRHIYGLDVVEIPTNKPLVRLENPDVIYRSGREKWDAVVEEIAELSELGRPVLVGTISIEKSEHLSTLLRRKNIRHVVLNAKYHEQEASIIAQAGRIGAVTIATNMAGEFSMVSELARINRIPSDWGLEVETLAEVYRNYSLRRICQAEICETYEHKHQPLSAEDPGSGLMKMAIDIAKSVLRNLAVESIVLSDSGLRTLVINYQRTAKDAVKRYRDDADFNGLAFDYHLETVMVEAFTKAIQIAGKEFMEDPLYSPLIPSWNRVTSAIPDFLENLRQAVEADNA